MRKATTKEEKRVLGAGVLETRLVPVLALLDRGLGQASTLRRAPLCTRANILILVAVKDGAAGSLLNLAVCP